MKTTPTHLQENSCMSLAECVRRTLDESPIDPDSPLTTDLHALVIQSVERPLLAWVLEQTGTNQTNAARLLGINRNTLHRKLAQYNML